MARRRNRKQEPSILALALEKSWKVAAGLALFSGFVTTILIPNVIGTNKYLGALAPMLQIPGWILTGIFALIAAVKFMTGPRPDNVETIQEGSHLMNALSRQSFNANNDAMAEWGHEFRRPAPESVPEQPAQWSLALLKRIEWKRFEELVAAYFRETGYRTETIRCGADGGVDAKIYRGDELISIVQCKAWNSQLVGVKPVRELLGVMAHQKVGAGVFFATGGFTSEALQFAHENPLTLITGEEFLKAISVLPEPAQQRLLAVATEGDYLTPTCPSCGIKMVRREGGGKTFWGCQNFPRCRQTFFVAN